MGLRISPVKDLAVRDTELGEIEYMPPTAIGMPLRHPTVINDLDFPYEPADHEPIDWDLFGDMKPDIAGYFVTVDSSGKSDMDRFIEEKMDFGKDEELPIAPPSVNPAKKKVARPPVNTSNLARSRQSMVPRPRQSLAPVKGKLVASSQIKSQSQSWATTTRQLTVPPQSRRMSMAPAKKPKAERFVRPGMAEELAILEKEELELCRTDDYGASFDLEL